MKRYLVFAGPDYYPAGGWGDFIGAFATFEEAGAEVEKHPCLWTEIVDLACLETVQKSSWAPDFPYDEEQ